MNIESDDAMATVTVEIAEDLTIKSVVTTDSVDQLGLEPGGDVVVAFKTNATRAMPTEI